MSYHYFQYMETHKIDYLQNFWWSQELLFVVDPFLELTTYHTNKVVFTGGNFQNLSDEERMEINAVLKKHYTEIPENQIQVVSLVQDVATDIPNVIDYKFEATTYQVEMPNNPNEAYVLGSIGMEGRLHIVQGPELIDIRIESSIPKLSKGIIDSIRERIFWKK